MMPRVRSRTRDGKGMMTMSDDDLRKQFSMPMGDDGRIVMERMNEHHVPLWTEASARLPKSMDGAVLDIGCGGGGFIRMLSEKYPFAMFFGVDISDDAVSMTADVNREMVDGGALDLRVASVESLPFGDASFDMVTAIETYFFWPDLEKGMREIARVVSPGGVVMLASELRLGEDDDSEVRAKCDEYGMTLADDDSMLAVMDAAGIDAEAIVTGSGVLYRGIRRF